jgi:sarcosine oxidase subunit gamma
VSDSYGVFSLSGSEATDVLLHGCSMDLHDTCFPAGSCTRTGLAQTEMILHKISAAPEFEIYTDVSYANYIANWFEKIIGDQ